MSKPIEQRPPQVTMAATIAIAASLMALASAWTRVSNLNSLASRNAIEEFLSSPPGKDLGMSVADVLTIWHVSAVVAAVCATVTAILGWFILQRDKRARIVLGVAATVLFLSAVASSGFATGLDVALASGLVASAALMLWMPPAREWFATGRWTPPAPTPPPTERRAPSPPSLPAAQGGDERPGPSEVPYATARPVHAGTYPLPPQHPAPGAHVAGPTARPGALVAAFVTTAVSTFVVGLVALMAILLVAIAPDLVVEEVARQQGGEVSMPQIRWSTYVTGGLVLVMCVMGFALAALAMRGREWARRGWMVAAGSAVVLCLLTVVSAPAAGGIVAMVPGTAAALTLGLLRRGEVRSWYAGPR